MDKHKLEEKRKELIKLRRTENLHYGLKELNENDAKSSIESMTEFEICKRVPSSTSQKP